MLSLSQKALLTMHNQASAHQAVLVEEVISALDPQPGKTYIDATFGRGGHSGALLAKGSKIIGFDFDVQSIERAKETFKKELTSGQLILQRENFTQMEATLANLKKSLDLEINGILFDFGTSTDQLMSKERGFSFEATDELLDMRMDERLGVRAADLLKLLDERQMAGLFAEYGGEEHAKAIAHKIVQVRKQDPQSLDRVGTLVTIIESIKRGQVRGRIHPATKVFQALRIIVNDELRNIELALPMSVRILKQSAALSKRLVCIAFHEGEDRLVKTFFKQQEAQGLGTCLTRKALGASEQELETNPRARSARLRVLAL